MTDPNMTEAPTASQPPQPPPANPRCKAHHSLTTPRLLLRSALPADGPALYAMKADPRNDPRHQGVPNPAWSPAWFAERAGGTWRAGSAEGRNASLVVVRRDTSELMGTAGFNKFQTTAEGLLVGDVGITIAWSHWRRGYAREAMCAMVGYGFGTLRLDRVVVDTDVHNVEMAALMRDGLGLGGVPGVEREGSIQHPGDEAPKPKFLWELSREVWEEARERMVEAGRWPL